MFVCLLVDNGIDGWPTPTHNFADVASPREEGEEEVAYVMRVNGALRRRLGEKEAEIAALLER